MTTPTRHRWRQCLPAAGGVTVVVAGFVAWALIQFGSLHDAWLYAGGVRVMIQPAVVSLPDGRVGEERDAVFLVRNLTSGPVAILGVTTQCSCSISTDELPIKLPPSGAKEVHLKFGLGKAPTGRIERTVVYHTDHPAAPSLMVRVTGRVVGL